LRKYRKTQTNDETLNRIQQSIAEVVDPLSAAPFASTVTKTVLIGTTDTQVHHGLGAPPTGYLVVRQDALATIAEVTVSPNPRKYLLLRASAPVTATLIIF
jgi:hypothetical protein